MAPRNSFLFTKKGHCSSALLAFHCVVAYFHQQYISIALSRPLEKKIIYFSVENLDPYDHFNAFWFPLNPTGDMELSDITKKGMGHFLNSTGMRYGGDRHVTWRIPPPVKGPTPVFTNNAQSKLISLDGFIIDKDVEHAITLGW